MVKCSNPKKRHFLDFHTDDTRKTVSQYDFHINKQSRCTGGGTVTFDYNLVDIPNISIKIEQGSKTIEAKPINKDGFEFVGWLNNETLYDFNEGVYSDLVLTASFAPEKPKTNKIVFIQENEINITIDIVDNIEIGSIIGVKQIPVNIEIENYKFIGWYEQDSLTPFDFGNIIDKDYILVAKYELLDTNVRVSFMINGVLLNNKVIYTKLGSTINEPLLPDDPNNILIDWVDESGNYYNFDVTSHNVFRYVIYNLK